MGYTPPIEELRQKFNSSTKTEGQNENYIVILCPLSQKKCLGENCAWFMPHQKACAMNVLVMVILNDR